MAGASRTASLRFFHGLSGDALEVTVVEDWLGSWPPTARQWRQALWLQHLYTHAPSFRWLRVVGSGTLCSQGDCSEQSVDESTHPQEVRSSVNVCPLDEADTWLAADELEEQARYTNVGSSVHCLTNDTLVLRAFILEPPDISWKISERNKWVQGWERSHPGILEGRDGAFESDDEAIAPNTDAFWEDATTALRILECFTPAGSRGEFSWAGKVVRRPRQQLGAEADDSSTMPPLLRTPESELNYAPPWVLRNKELMLTLVEVVAAERNQSQVVDSACGDSQGMAHEPADGDSCDSYSYLIGQSSSARVLVDLFSGTCGLSGPLLLPEFQNSSDFRAAAVPHSLAGDQS
eukprot:TRINITY_DN101278_c0_g1_i1.p1 TRINITY_DN101278_c0_g1~~TRINITY_DN101278_c0_g1_i1.p1  ORF type:complete len:349 (+),score=30.27 TRINITY_DN101278_c0_g1_i1:38-1084(+)